jgi:threonylcarbamoyladenosine tRNA methylthiotransferase MtaB
MKIAFTTLGCKLNFAESSALGKALLERGHTRAKQGEEADICIINTCSVTDTADHKDRQAIHRIRRQNPKAILIVTGCYAQLKPGEIAQIEGVDFVLGQDEKFHLPEFIKRLEDLKIRKFEDLKIESIREGEVPGTHEVKWDSEEDTIIITHIAKGRRGFALGAILAAESLI